MTRKEWLEIHRLHDLGLSIRAIAKRLGSHRRRVRKALESNRPVQRTGRPRGSIVDDHRGWLLAKLEQYPELSAARLHGMLREQGFSGSYSLVKQTVADLRPRLKPVYQTLHFNVGECAQVVEAIGVKKHGKVEIHGTRWAAQADQDIAQGDTVKVLGKDNLTLTVERI